ncbi:WAT1-related protein At1g43650-like [Neltuma alba]|uniref:WAT1-related protein At1g43650-like n=1 Tax=Neltuma alba TaxID=207710 RepID=UPI0010A54545|nr:WAT1-related protein At1g43650-like [Prosopis alba]XP_028772722.1 WAT1-related protein At1g43650-like [Prosopis alba]
MRSLLRLVGRYKAYAAMIIIQIIGAGLALLSKAAIAKGMNLFVFVVYRQAFAFVSLSPFAFFDRKQDTSLTFTVLSKIFLVTLVGLTLATNFYCASLNYVSATLASAFANIIPAVTFIMAVIFRVESVSMKQMDGKAKIVGSILSLGGAIIFALVKGPPVMGSAKGHASNEQHNSHSLVGSHSKGDQIKGVIMMLSSNVTMALWLILQGFVVKKYPAKLRFTALQCFFCCTQTAVLAVILERDPSAWKLGWDLNLLAVAYCGLVVTGVSYWLQLCVIEEKGAVFPALFTPLAFIITAIFSAFAWRETLHWGSVGGMILVVVGLYSVLWGKNRESKRERSHEIESTRQLRDDNHTSTLDIPTTHNAPVSRSIAPSTK